MVSKKHRRHGGWRTPRPTIPVKLLNKYNLSLDLYYDDWADCRDGFRDWFNDFKLIRRIYLSRYPDDEMVSKRLRMNRKQRRLVKRREVY